MKGVGGWTMQWNVLGSSRNHILKVAGNSDFERNLLQKLNKKGQFDRQADKTVSSWTVCFYHVTYTFRVNLHSVIA